MPIKSKYTTNNTPSQSVGPDGKKRNPLGQPPQFEATGRGLNVAYPETGVANSVTHNAFFIANFWDAKAMLDRPWLHKMYLYIESFETSWAVSGSYGQTQKSRTWYPHNLTQNDFTLTGRMINQFEYDKLVEFVAYHQKHMLSAIKEIVESPSADQFNPTQVEAVEFYMGLARKPRKIPNADDDPTGRIDFGSDVDISTQRSADLKAQHKFRQAPEMNMTLAILDIKAGHERFQFAPAFTLTCKVLNDHLQEDYDTQDRIRETVYDDPVLIFADGPLTTLDGFSSYRLGIDGGGGGGGGVKPL